VSNTGIEPALTVTKGQPRAAGEVQIIAETLTVLLDLAATLIG